MSEELEKTHEEIIEDHRKAMMLSGNLSKFFVDNLQAFPYIVFDNLEKAEISYNFYKVNDNGDKEIYPGTVEFDIFTKENSEVTNEEMKKRSESLVLFVKFLFWQETKVSIKREGLEWIASA